MPRIRGTAAAFLLVVIASASSALGTVWQFDLKGKGGDGLLSTNENSAIVGTPGSGGEVGAGISYDDISNLLDIHIGWGSANGFINLSGNASDHHIHGPTANPAPAGYLDNASVRIGLAALPGFNNSASAGGFNGTITLDATQETELLANRYYLNVHTTTNSGGEIRGQMVVVPEPASLAVLGIAAAMPLIIRRRT